MSKQLSGAAVTAKEPFSVMAKPVGSLCNLQCSYCYYSETGPEQKRTDGYRMPERLLDRFIRQYIKASPGPVVPFTWHGGEPTLAGLSYYRRAVQLQKQYLPDGWSCWNNLQTNGMLLDDSWCAFLAEEHFDVGLSIDGTQWLHDRFRKDGAGFGTYERAVAAIVRLQTHGIQPDLLCTVNAATAKDPLAVYRTLRNLHTGWIQFIAVVRKIGEGRLSEDSVSGRDYGNFLCAVFDEWIYHDLGRLDVQLFAETARVWSGGSAGLCWMAPTCGRVLVVEHDGGVYSCDHYVTPDHRIGSLDASSLRDLVDLPEQRRFGLAKRDALPTLCLECPWLDVCNGGCPKDRIAPAGIGEPNLNYLCQGLRQFFAHAEKPLKMIIQMKNSGIAPEAMMARLRAEAKVLWKGVGRNDPCPCGSGKKAKNCCWDRRP